MRLVYSLRNELARNPEHVAAAQALTKDQSRPFGLKGTNGLFGSEEWWANIESGRASMVLHRGVISRIKHFGMHNESVGFEMTLPTGGTFEYDCVADHSADLSRFVVGEKIEVKLVVEDLKNPSPTKPTSEIVTEISLG